MGGLILLVILAILVFIILPVSLLIRSGEQKRLLESLYERIFELKNEVAGLSAELAGQREKIPVKPLFKEAPAKIIIPEKNITKETKPEAVIIPEPVQEKKIITPQPPAQTMPVTDQTEFNIFSNDEFPFIKQKKDTDLEKFIGENLISKIGIAVLVLGIAFFIKYAIDKNWVNEGGRVIIGLISGTILIGLAHYFRNSYRSFSSVLVGGGLTVFYFSIGFAFHQYHLIGQTSAFIFMIAISCFAVILSLFYNRQELAILATIGGFITPFLVNTGQENHIALFTYLCILNAGLTALSWFKRWPAINTISLFFTTIIFGGWLIKHLYYREPATLPSKSALLFASLFYFLFIAMNIINNTRLKSKFSAFDFIIVLGVNFLYYAAGIIILEQWGNGKYQGLFTAFAGLFNLLLTAVFYKRKGTDRNFVLLLMGLAVTFISLVAPVQFKTNFVTLFWAAEAVILLMLAQQSKIKLLKLASLVMLALTLASLAVNFATVYTGGNDLIPVVLNKGFITAVCATAALFLYLFHLRKETHDEFIQAISTAKLKTVVTVIFITVLFLAGLLEVYFQFHSRFTEVALHTIYTQVYSFAFVIVLLRLFRKSPDYSLMKTILTTVCLVLFLLDLSSTFEVSDYLLSYGKNKAFFTAHWASSLMLIGLLSQFTCSIFKKSKAEPEYNPDFAWISLPAIVFLLSTEMYLVMHWTNNIRQEDAQWWNNLYYKAGLSILWSICSFVFMSLGMKYSIRPLRIISLTLFTITLAKLFVYDIRNIPPGGKIAAFILLGCLLLIVSFMYQRLKKIIIDNNTGKKKE